MDDRTITCLLMGIPTITVAVLIIVVFTGTAMDSDPGLFTGALVCLVFLILGNVFILDYGGEDSAGWNTHTEEEKSRFDERKIFQATGLMMSVGGIILFIAFMGRRWFPNALFVFVGLMIVWFIVMLVYINTSETFIKVAGNDKDN